jgi:hypothetical protein
LIRHHETRTEMEGPRRWIGRCRRRRVPCPLVSDRSAARRAPSDRRVEAVRPASSTAAAVERRNSTRSGGKKERERLEVTDSLAPQAHRAGTHRHSRGLPTCMAQSEQTSVGFACEHVRWQQPVE